MGLGTIQFITLDMVVNYLERFQNPITTITGSKHTFKVEQYIIEIFLTSLSTLKPCLTLFLHLHTNMSTFNT